MTTEKELQANVLEAAALYGLLAYHTHDSRRSQPGFPDLVLVGPGGVEFWELKSAKGRLSHDQEHWRVALQQAGASWRLFRPADWDAIMERIVALSRTRESPPIDRDS